MAFVPDRLAAYQPDQLHAGFGSLQYQESTSAFGRKRTLILSIFQASERPLSGKADIRDLLFAVPLTDSVPSGIN
jgi:hypothetical protein